MEPLDGYADLLASIKAKVGIVTQLPSFFLLKCRKNGELPLKNDDFPYKTD